MKQFELGFGNRTVSVTLPEDQLLAVVEGQPVKAIDDIPQAVKEALQHPIGCPPLGKVVTAGDTVVIVASDITRMWVRHDLFLPTLLDELNQAGVADENITLMVALGAHRPQTAEENVKIYGEEVVARVKIIQSRAQNSEDFVSLGQTSRSVQVQLHHRVVQADKVILTGGIVYHSMAGFSGGRKAILPGIASYASIQGNHSFCLHEKYGKGLNPHCDSGSLADNPMNQDQLEMAQMLNPAFLFNAVFTPEGHFARFVAGHWYEAWLEGCRTVKQIYGVPLSGQADITLVSAGGFPKDINFYQGSKAIENAFAATKKGGVLIALMECRDILEPPDFSQWFNYQSLYEREMALRKTFTVPGFVALKIGIIAQTVSVIMVTLPENREFFRQAGIAVAATVTEALEMAEQKLGSGHHQITVMPHAANTVPLLTNT